MKTYKKPVISAIQKLRLNKWLRGELKDSDLYGVLVANINDIPWRIKKNPDDKVAIRWMTKYSIVCVHVHESINFWDMYEKRYGKKRHQHWIYKKKKAS